MNYMHFMHYIHYIQYIYIYDIPDTSLVAMIDHGLPAVLSWALLGGLWQVIWKPWVCRSPESVAQVLVKSLGKKV